MEVNKDIKGEHGRENYINKALLLNILIPARGEQ